MKDVDTQWQEWQDTNPLNSIPIITDEQLKEALIKDLSVVSQMTVEEYTLYQKWLEVHNKYPTHMVNTLFGEEKQLTASMNFIKPDNSRRQ